MDKRDLRLTRRQLLKSGLVLGGGVLLGSQALRPLRAFAQVNTGCAGQGYAEVFPSSPWPTLRFWTGAGGLLLAWIGSGLGGIGQAEIVIKAQVSAARTNQGPGLVVPSPTEGAAASHEDVLEFLNGDKLHGTFLSLDAKNGARWQHPAVRQVISISPTSIARIVLDRPRSTNSFPQQQCGVRLANSDQLVGELVSLDENVLSLETWYAGQLSIPRKLIGSISPGQLRSSAIYEGPLGGAVIYAVSLVVVMYGLTVLQGRSGVLLVLFGLFCIGAFVLWELRVPSPLLDMPLLTTNVTFSMSNIAALINYSATFAVTFLISLYLQYLKGFTPRQAGLVLIAQPVVMAAFSPLAGRLSDRIEPRIVASIGMGFTAAGLALFGLLDARSSLWFILVNLIVIGFGFALFSSPNTNAVMSSIDRRYYGSHSDCIFIADSRFLDDPVMMRLQWGAAPHMLVRQPTDVQTEKGSGKSLR